MSGKILIVTTSAATMPKSAKQTGVWMEELSTPYYAFADAGLPVTVASLSGGAVPVDPNSLKPVGQNDRSVERFLQDEQFKRQVADTPLLASVDVDSFDAIFLPGGHGTMFDYPEDQLLGSVVSRVAAQQKIVAAVCHGPAGLLRARAVDGKPFVAGRRVTGFTNSEEDAVGLSQQMPFLLETALRDRGAIYEQGPDFEPFSVRDGLLFTGQNPASAASVAELVIGSLRDR